MLGMVVGGGGEYGVRCVSFSVAHAKAKESDRHGSLQITRGGVKRSENEHKASIHYSPSSTTPSQSSELLFVCYCLLVLSASVCLPVWVGVHLSIVCVCGRCF